MTPVLPGSWLTQTEGFSGLDTKNSRAASGESCARICSVKANVSSLMVITRSNVCPLYFCKRYVAVAPLRDASAKDERGSRDSKLKCTGKLEPSRMRVSACSIMAATSGKSGSSEERKSTLICCRACWGAGEELAAEHCRIMPRQKTQIR